MVAAGLVAFVTALALTPLVLLALGRARILDHPTQRSSHDQPVIRGGGMALALACISGLTFAAIDTTLPPTLLGVLIASAAFGLLGLAEDILGVPTLQRFLLQVCAAALSLSWLLPAIRPLPWLILACVAAVVWLVGYVNAFNFMDGINGISSVQSLIVGVTWAWIGHNRDIDALGWGGVILAGAACGFLPFNFPRALLFPGDIGSYFIGGWQASLVIIGLRARLPAETVAAPLALYLADTSYTLLRRVVAGETWYLPHREHAYQHLVRGGWSHTRTTFVVGLFMIACSLTGTLALRSVWIRVIGDCVLIAILATYLVLPRIVGSSTSSTLSST